MNRFDAACHPTIVARLQSLMQQDPLCTRSGLSRHLCGLLNWRDANGRPQEVDGRKALLRLERFGQIVLPVARAVAPPLRAPAAQAELQAADCTGPLSVLGGVELVPLCAQDRALAQQWRALLQAFHPNGAGSLCGAQQRYLVRSEIGWIGALAFSAAAWRLKARDEWIGWSDRARSANLRRVVGNTRFLIVPSVRVPHLASKVLGLAAQVLPEHWRARYGDTPLLLEAFIDESLPGGNGYQAANWQRVGQTCGRGRGDRAGHGRGASKGIYVLPLDPQARLHLQQAPLQMLQIPPTPVDPVDRSVSDWAAEEFGRVRLSDGRLRGRLVELARDFHARPLAPLPQTCDGDAAKLKAAYRFFRNPSVDLPTLLQPHIEATVARLAEYPVVLAVQDTTSLNYTAHPATQGLGPINTRNDNAKGLKLHDTVAFTPNGVPLGVLDAQCWARDPGDRSRSERRKTVPMEEKESLRWLTSYRRVAAMQALCPNTRLISVGDREADIFELFDEARCTANGPDLLIRADQGRQRQVHDEDGLAPLWTHLPTRPVSGALCVRIPGKGGRQARDAHLTIRHAPVRIKPPKHLRREAVDLWAIHALETDPPEGSEAVEWLLLTTVETIHFEQARERLAWYATRWSIEVFHRTLKSGCRIEDRRLARSDSLQACLALDMAIAWRILYLTKLGREAPDLPCTVMFDEEEWQSLCMFHSRTPQPPETPPTLGTAMRMVAKLGGFLGRKHDGHPGAEMLWRGIERLSDITQTFRILRPAVRAGP